jgi:serine phosphatase RsbU (regulator of sigma subunit)
VRKGEVIEAKANRFPVGISFNPQPYTTHTFTLEKGDVIYISTDGFVDQFGGEAGKKFKSLQFKSLLVSIAMKEMDEQKRLLDKAFEEWRGELEQVDDVCVIGLRF